MVLLIIFISIAVIYNTYLLIKVNKNKEVPRRNRTIAWTLYVVVLLMMIYIVIHTFL